MKAEGRQEGKRGRRTPPAEVRQKEEASIEGREEGRAQQEEEEEN